MRVYRSMRLVVFLCLFIFALGCTDQKASAEQAKATAPSAGAGGLPVDIGDLRDDEKRSFVKLIQKYPSACGKAHSLEQSLKTDPQCRRSVFAARYLKHLLSLHLLSSEVEEHYDERFGNVEKHQIDVSQAPLKGEAHAPVTLVEFSDFQCPHCKHLQPTLERVLDEYRGQVRLYFKHYPIERAHPDAKLAAAAACAAGKQSKFWSFHDKLFGGNQDKEDLPVLEGYAGAVKLDMKKWKADIEACKPLVERDHADGEKLEISATPTLYINGKLYRGPNRFEELKDWIDEELNK